MTSAHCMLAPKRKGEGERSNDRKSIDVLFCNYSQKIPTSLIFCN